LHLNDMPVMLQGVSVISPIRWFIDATNGMSYGINWFSNTRNICIISGMVLILLVISVYINKKNRVI